MLLGQTGLKKKFLDADEAEQKAKMNAEQGQELEYAQEHVTQQKQLPAPDRKKAQNQTDTEMESLIDRELEQEYSEEQKTVLRNALTRKVPLRELMDYYYPDVSAEEMRRAWRL